MHRSLRNPSFRPTRFNHQDPRMPSKSWKLIRSDEFNGPAELEQFTVRLEDLAKMYDKQELTARLEQFTGADRTHDLQQEE